MNGGKNKKQKMNLKNKRIIVTGAAGVIGRQVVKILEKKKAQPICFDISQRPHEFMKKTAYIQQDLSKLNNHDFLDFNPDIVIHLAAVFERLIETEEYWDLNFDNEIILNHGVFDAARRCRKLTQFIFASSYLIYDAHLYLSKKPKRSAVKIAETDAINPRNLCGISKLYGEREIEFLKNFSNFKLASARIYRVYGIGSRDVISRWIRSGISGQAIEIFNKENSFDYIWAEDVATGLTKIAENDYEGIINIGTGKAKRIAEVARNIQKHLPTMKVKYVKNQQYFENSCADTSRMKRYLKWVPSITIEEGIKKIFEYESVNSFS